MSPLVYTADDQSKEWDGAEKSFTMISGGKVSDRRDIAIPALQESDNGLKELGFSDEGGDEAILMELTREHRAEPTGAFGVEVILWGVVTYLKVKVGEWALKKVFDEIYTAKLRPGLEKAARTFKATREDKGASKLLIFKYGAFFAPSNVFVGIVIQGDSESNFLKSDKRVEDARKVAAAWIAREGITKRVINITIRNGIVDPKPVLADVIPRDV